MDNYFAKTISEETFSAWLDGTMSVEDEKLFLEVSAADEDFQNLLDANDQVEESYEDLMENGYDLPEELQEDFDIPEIYDQFQDDDDDSSENLESYDLDDEDDDDHYDTSDDLNSYDDESIGDDDLGPSELQML